MKNSWISESHNRKTIMIRRNIDVSLGHVNGTIGTITLFIQNDNEIDKIKIMLLSEIEHILKRVSVKFG